MGGMPTITPVHADVTALEVDAIVNPTNSARWGAGGGVDGAVHRVGGPAILRDCVARFPHGLAAGDAGWTTAGNLRARWVIHTVGPSHAAGQRDRGLLESCYRRSLAVADELGARSVAFPLIGGGRFGWPRGEAITVAVEVITTAETRVDQVWLVANDTAVYEDIVGTLAQWTSFRILQGVQVLHRRYHQVRVYPAVSPTGMAWRALVMVAGNMADDGGVYARNTDEAIHYTSANGPWFAGPVPVTVATSPETVADDILAALPSLVPNANDPGYVAWFDGLMELVECHHALPIASADYFDDSLGWEIGWGSGLRYPPPPAAKRSSEAVSNTSTSA